MKPTILRNVIRYWVKLLEAEQGTAVAEAYQVQLRLAEIEYPSWGLKLKTMLFGLGFGNVWIGQRNLNGKLFMSEFLQRCVDSDLQNWRNNVSNFGTLRTYRVFKENLILEPYLKMQIPRKTKYLFTKLRGGLLHLEANLGRWSQHRKEYETRICPLCNLKNIEDEFHVLFVCPVWSCFRQQLSFYTCFKNKNLVELCNTSNSYLVKDVVKFLDIVLFERKEMLEVL